MLGSNRTYRLDVTGTYPGVTWCHRVTPSVVLGKPRRILLRLTLHGAGFSRLPGSADHTIKHVYPAKSPPYQGKPSRLTDIQFRFSVRFLQDNLSGSELVSRYLRFSALASPWTHPCGNKAEVSSVW